MQVFSAFFADFVDGVVDFVEGFCLEGLGFWGFEGFVCESFCGFFESCEIYGVGGVFESVVFVAVTVLGEEGEEVFGVLSEGLMFDF